MADTNTEQEVQTKHVLEVALANLSVVIDQLQSINSTKADSVLEALDTAKSDLTKLVG